MNTEFFKKQLAILHLEDNDTDHLLVSELLRENGLNCAFALARNKDEFTNQLHQSRFDLIISDFSLPSYDGLSALSIAHELHPETPFIFFSGTIGEELAVDSLRNGATDYVLKQRPRRLVAAVRRALNGVAERSRLKKAETALQQTEERLQIIARATNDVIWEWDIQTNRFLFNENFKSAFGHEADDNNFPSEKFFNLIHPADKNRIVTGLSTLLASGGRVWWSEHRLSRADGSYAYVFDRASIIYDHSSRPIRMVGVTIDVTERKLAEQKIYEQAALLDKAQDAIVVLDQNRNVSYWNQGAEKIYGWTAAEAIGKTMTELAFHGRTTSQLEEVIRTVEAHGEWLGEINEFTKDGRKVIIRSRCNLVRDEQGAPKACIIIGTDITERKQLEEQFTRAQHLESLGVLVSGIAHDLNNCLTPLAVGLVLLRDENLSVDGRDVLDMMDNTTKRSVEMIKQVLTFARGGSTVKVPLRINSMIKEMAKVIADTFPKNIQCQTVVAEDAHMISANAIQLHQVLLNLCVNARDAMPEGGLITISTENVLLNEQDVAMNPEARPGDYLCIMVCDHGNGISDENLQKIFQPFFTTKPPGKGTGLGLASSRAIIYNHSGLMTVQSECGKGATFKIFLPAVADTTRTTLNASTSSAPLPGGQGQRVLVVDDEAAILAIERATLAHYGYKVTVASNGVDALLRVKNESQPFDLIITDLSMPLMDGVDLISELKKKNPDLNFIVASGSIADHSKLKEHLPFITLLAKPFTTERLLHTVNDALSGRQS